MNEEDLSNDSLQGNENNKPIPSSSVDDLLRQKLAIRLQRKKKRTKSLDSNSSSGYVVDSSIGIFEDHDLSSTNSDFSTDERFEVPQVNFEENDDVSIVYCSYKNKQKQDYDVTDLGNARNLKRPKFSNYLRSCLQGNVNPQNHVKNISFLNSESSIQKIQFSTSINKPSTFHTHQSNESYRREKKGSFEYLNDILNSYLLLPIAAEKLKECDIDVNFSIQSLCKGLCKQWTENETCDNENCAYTHEPKILFEKKLANFSSLNISAILLYLPNVQFDLEISIAGFQELVKMEREIPSKWIERLIFYIFTKSKSVEPCFLEFWFIVAKHFCNEKGVNNLSYGFVKLLNVIFNVKEEDRWRVIKFLEMIQDPPLQLHLSYQLLKPILNFDIPLYLIIKVIKTCNETQVDVVETYLEVFPKVPVDNLSLNHVEILLKFSEILSTFNKRFSEDLKKKLESKVLTLSEDITKDEYPLTHSYLYNLVPSPKTDNNYEFKSLMEDIVEELKENFNVDFFGTSINKIELSDVEKAVKEIMTVIFSIELAPQDAVDLIQAAVINSKNKSSESITATVAASLIYSYVTSQDWETACSILTICNNKDICLPYAKIIKRDLKLLTKLSQARLAFLLAEIYINNQKYQEFTDFLERYNLLSSSFRVWSLNQTEGDNRAKIQLIDNFFTSAFSEEAADSAYKFFFKIYKTQNDFHNPIDLRTYVSELIISLINQDNEALVDELKNLFCKDLTLKPIAVRSLLAYLVQKNRIEEAKEFFPFYAHKVYRLPPVVKTTKEFPYTLRVPSILSDEELYLLFEYFFSKMMKYKFAPGALDKNISEDCKFNIAVNVVNLEHDSNVKPWYLMDVINTEDAAIKRIENLLQKKIVPPLKTISMAKLIFVDHDSVYNLLLNRFSIVKKL